MEIEYAPAFIRDLKRVRSPEVRTRAERTIQHMKAAPSVTAISGAARITGRDRYYRVRIGDYRLGFAAEGETAVLLRLLHRRDIYRYFP